MIVYGHRDRPVCPPAGIRLLRREAASLARHAAPSHDDVVDLLIRFGEIEAAVADARAPLEDGVDPLVDRFREAALAIAEAFCRSRDRATGEIAPPLERFAALLAPLDAAGLPERAAVRTPEGFAYFSVYPEMYVEAAREVVRELRPASALCIGVRSIGTTLSAVVGAALALAGVAARTITVRPRGHPLDRRLRVSPALGAALAAVRPAHVLVVDEGPGLSGSSMAAAAEWASSLDVPDDRIHLLPAWRPDPAALRSETARRRWGRHRLFTGSFDAAWAHDCLKGSWGPPSRLRLAPSRLAAARSAEAAGGADPWQARLDGGLAPAGSVRDWSAGAWRRWIVGADERRYPAVHPQHERRKYLVDGPSPRLLRFVGLGPYGRARLDRARRLADAGFVPRPLALARGFLASEFVPGRPLARGEASQSRLDRMAGYLAFLRRNEPTGTAPGLDRLVSMVRTNVLEALGAASVSRFDRLARDLGALRDESTVAIDGRLLPHEWIAGPGDRLLKADALDHHDDDFFPGCQDVAWDLAGAIVEFALTGPAEAGLVEAYRTRAGDRHVAARLPFYKAAYLAFRLGYVSLAIETLGATPDGRRFERLRRRYRRCLTEVLTIE